MIVDNAAMELAQAVRALSELKVEAKDSAAAYRARIEKAEERLSSLASDIREGQGRLDFTGVDKAVEDFKSIPEAMSVEVSIPGEKPVTIKGKGKKKREH